MDTALKRDKPLKIRRLHICKKNPKTDILIYLYIKLDNAFKQPYYLI
jgi:hypothetical protein